MDFNSLVNEILGMVRTRQDFNIKQTEDEAWQKRQDARDQFNNALGVRAMNRDDALNLEKTKSVGELARQRLTNEGTTNVATITGRAHVAGEETMAGAHRYAADQKLEGDKYIAGAKDQPFSVWMKANPGADEETVKRMKKYFGAPEVKPEDVRSFDRTVAPDTVTPPIRTNTPATTLPGAPSMEFPRTDLGPSRESLALAKKKSEENLLYGTKPQKRSWLSAF
jgi:hypothetical protein